MTEPVSEDILLDRFRRWFRDAREEAAACEPASNGVDEEIGLQRLVEEFTALRHEVKLQTKGSRGLQDQTEALLPALRQAIEHFKAVEPRDARAAWAAGKPLAEAIAEFDEALDRGRFELEKARHRLVDEAESDLLEAFDAHLAGQSWFRRRLMRSYHESARQVVRQRGPGSRRPHLDALIEGYMLIQSRLRRAMEAEEIERIETVGLPVDPELMTVVEMVDEPRGSVVEVVDEVRRGYTWRGRILRYAEVRASRLPNPSNEEQPESYE